MCEIKSQQKVCQAGYPLQRKPNIGLHVLSCLAFEASINFPNSTDLSGQPVGSRHDQLSSIDCFDRHSEYLRHTVAYLSKHGTACSTYSTQLIPSSTLCLPRDASPATTRQYKSPQCLLRSAPTRSLISQMMIQPWESQQDHVSLHHQASLLCTMPVHQMVPAANVLGSGILKTHSPMRILRP